MDWILFFLLVLRSRRRVELPGSPGDDFLLGDTACWGCCFGNIEFLFDAVAFELVVFTELFDLELPFVILELQMLVLPAFDARWCCDPAGGGEGIRNV